MSGPPKLLPPTRRERIAFKLWRRWPASYVAARLAHADALSAWFNSKPPKEAIRLLAGWRP